MRKDIKEREKISLSRKEKTLVREALRCLKEVKKSLAVQANLWEWYQCDSPGTKKASQRRKKIDKAIIYLEEWIRPTQEIEEVRDITA